MNPLILALDQGTSSSRAIIFNKAQEALATFSQTIKCKYPQSGWVEQDANEIWSSQLACLQGVLRSAKVNLSDITGIGVTNQRETIIAWDKVTSKPLGPAIVWQCRRTIKICQGLKEKGLEPTFKNKTGLLLDPYFSGTKMRWLLENNPDVAQAATEGRLAFGTVDSWLIWNLTGGKLHVTDASNASRTLLFNIKSGQWDAELLGILQIPLESLPTVVDSSGQIGVTDQVVGGVIPIAGICGDQQAALFGQCCFEVAQVKNTYGTGCFMLANTGTRPITSHNNLLTTVAWQIDGVTHYALEGSVFIAGALIQWLRDQLGLFTQAKDTEAMALSVENSEGVFVVPAFVGLGAPHWDATARGAILGLTAQANKNHIVRAALEAIAYQATELLHSMEKDMGAVVKSIRVDGGAAQNGFLCQFQADLTGCDVALPEQTEATALGAALLAGLALGVWESKEEIQKLWRQKHLYKPTITRPKAEKLMAGWGRAVERSKNWVE
ncbi:MAG: glycerol kinase GlpK [SAR324 cluster bacterium]|nr:glycerol kinase GlpK [SAR324 cluster bacterium]